MWQTYFQPASLDDALTLLHRHAGQSRIVAGGTDVVVELQRGVRPISALIDITALPNLRYIRREDDTIHIGALATHNNIIASADCRQDAWPLAQACVEVGAPQIRTRATVAGNLITASPANDTITPLMALGAEVVLVSALGERIVPLDQFYLGVRRTVIAPDELLREIRVPALGPNRRGLFLKLGLRRAQAISVINLAIVLRYDAEVVTDARITLGCLAPTVVHATRVEAFLRGQRLSAEVCAEAGRLASQDVAPIDDLRGSAAYRLSTLRSLVTDGLRRLAAGREREGWMERPVLLEANMPSLASGQAPEKHAARSAGRAPELATGVSVGAIINGRPTRLSEIQGKTLLDALREDAGLTGTKEGCAEGECGACTVWLDGQAAMACLVPAPQAHNTSVTTIEGLAAAHGTPPKSGQIGESGASHSLHPLQRAFIEHGAVQCGYCIPGILMAGAKLLEEHPRPTTEQAQVALSGNICRCTGYRKILDAVLDASQQDSRVNAGWRNDGDPDGD